MNRIPFPEEVDKSNFGHDTHPQQVKYGLPLKVEFCRKCVISNQRPNSAVEFNHTKDSKKVTIAFTDGVCDACKFAEKKHSSIEICFLLSGTTN